MGITGDGPGRSMTAEEVAELPVVLDPVTAGRLLGIGRTSTYRLLETGAFPAPAFRAGTRWRIPTSGVCALLGLAYPPTGGTGTRGGGRPSDSEQER
ncbi:helix-turn-helix domain-containing protein [Streptomonospora salina]|uniref:Excisionase family DNA binding protein n=1 Tax=Streptomonospora salina TaxID=104205 RepID=A0A841EH84_9ACTN|nr:helix-turn-helix domain-containing protein [Streptomonospora salina]MBB6000188.1 excisionase family DNA binding protein [Streptomonospora salina]